MMVRTRRAMVRWRRNTVMIVVMCSSLISLTGFLPIPGKMWLFSAPLNPEMDLGTSSADLLESSGFRRAEVD